MKGKLSCPYRGSETPVQGRSNPRTGENADPRRGQRRSPQGRSAPSPASEKEHAHGSFRLTCARAVLEQLVSQETRSCSFPFPFSLKGVKGEVLFSPSLFFDFADGDPPPVDNSSVFIGFSFRVFCCLCQPAIRLSLRSACSLPHGSRTPSRGGYPRPRENSLSAALVNRQTKKDPLAPSQKVLIRHKKSASTIDAQLPFEKV